MTDMLMMKKVLYIIVCLCVMLVPIVADAASAAKELKEGNRLYDQKKYEDAVNSYKKALESAPDSDRANFNLGTALYKQGKYQEAMDAFTKSLNTEDRKIEAGAVYNMANSKYKMGAEQLKTDPNSAVESYKQSLDYYKRAVELDRNNNDAKYNHELVEKELKILIDRLKNQPPPEKDEDKDKDKDKKENKEDEKEGDKQEGEQKKEDTGQQGEKDEGEQKTGQEKEAEEDDGTPQDNRKMTPEEAKMLLDTVGEEGDLKKQGSGHYRGVLKDW